MATTPSHDNGKAHNIFSYYCTLSSIPHPLPLSLIAEHVMPQPSSRVVAQLETHGLRIVPRQLHVYKEPLETKFGFINFWVQSDNPHIIPENSVHKEVIHWITTDLTAQLLAVNVSVQLAQPSECHFFAPFLKLMGSRCALLDPNHVQDVKKMETFLLSRVRFYNNGEHSVLNDMARPHSGEDGEEEPKETELLQLLGQTECKVAGTFQPLRLTPKELLWMKKHLKGFPPIRITNGNMTTAHCDRNALLQYFEKALMPIWKIVT